MRRGIILAAAAASLGIGLPPIRVTYRKGEAPPRMRYVAPFVSPPTNGKREVARRLRQIQAGQLRVSA